MEFKKENIFTAVNADELRPGDKVIVAYNIGTLRWSLNYERIESLYKEIVEIKDENQPARFVVKAVGHDSKTTDYALAYLVERKENCTNCGTKCDVTFASCFHRCDNWKPETTEEHLCLNCKFSVPECPADYYDITFGNGLGNDNVIKCKKFEAKTNKKYRPFRDIDELIKVWDEKCQRYGVYGWQDEIEMPLIWIKHKKYPIITLISGFHDTGIDTSVSSWVITWEELLNSFTFLDGSPCGVEE